MKIHQLVAAETVKRLLFQGAVTKIRFAPKTLAVRGALEQTHQYRKAIDEVDRVLLRPQGTNQTILKQKFHRLQVRSLLRKLTA